ncbi:copper chaperone CopZ [Pseudalkalibacillus caeni]|uniref:Copper chaperone CopZ n=1 Tax=Exobacillus caeni TaxID=2574798 RepID=A0A5R9EZB1_9BACL|nr:copper chaperone CopZ [Pseudalkalibacillus caeni]TLS35430.1 copper chaperone CopZ [Pseudalkalibacillus caeni]
MENITLQIEGMTCGHCKQAVTNSLQELNGVENVQVNLEQNNAEVTYNPNQVSLEQMKEAVEEQGYDVKN